MEKIHAYSYTHDIQTLFDKLNNRTEYYHNYGRVGEYLIDKINKNSFWLGVERGGHSGYWFIANISEEDGKTIISGKIVYDPDENGNAEPTGKPSILEYIFFIVLYPLVLLISLIELIVRLITKKPKTKEEKLDAFMVDYLGCTKIS